MIFKKESEEKNKPEERGGEEGREWKKGWRHKEEWGGKGRRKKKEIDKKISAGLRITIHSKNLPQNKQTNKKTYLPSACYTSGT